MTKSLTIDPRSDEVILAYKGDGVRSARNAAPRDLTHNDVARLAYLEALGEVQNDVGQPIDREDPDSPLYERPDPRKVDQPRARRIIADLVASGLFKATRAAKPADDGDEQKDTPPPNEPEPPAEKPEA